MYRDHKSKIALIYKSENMDTLLNKYYEYIYILLVNKYRFCISVIGYINVQIIGIGYKKLI